MIGAHFDSWHSGTGATDNGVSSAVMMEAMRIPKATGLQPRRTIRMGLWTGEEQGLLGSRAYVKEHFADRETMALKPEHAKLSVYLNMDNGGGVFRGVYLQERSDRADLRGVDEAVRQHGDDDEYHSQHERYRIICRSMRWGCRASSSFRIRLSILRGRITPIWMCMSGRFRMI